MIYLNKGYEVISYSQVCGVEEGNIDKYIAIDDEERDHPKIVSREPTSADFKTTRSAIKYGLKPWIATTAWTTTNGKIANCVTVQKPEQVTACPGLNLLHTQGHALGPAGKPSFSTYLPSWKQNFQENQFFETQ